MEVKGIIHAHSKYSYDAKLSLYELRESLQKQGLHFVCMTEHTDMLTKERAIDFIKECDSFSDDAFCFIPGFEVPFCHTHILMIGIRSFHDVYAPTIQVLTQWTKEAPFVVLAHPVRNSFSVGKDLLNEIDALEVWNQQYDGKYVPRIRSLKLFNRLRTQKPGLIAIGGVDLHRREHIGTPIITLNVEKLTDEKIIEKLKMGAFTISSKKACFYGTLLNASKLISKYRWESNFSVSIITVGKYINKILANHGVSFHRSFGQEIRRHL